MHEELLRYRNREMCCKAGLKHGFRKVESFMIQAGLVLEGGGMKGVYTAGVLDFFLDKDMLFSSV